MDFDLIRNSFPQLLEASVLTLELVAVSLLIGLLLSVPLALARSAKSRWLNVLPTAYIFFFRGTPLLVQIFLIYYGLGQFEAVRESFLWPVLREAYWCAIIAFGMNTAAYTAEIIRGAINAVPEGEWEAAQSLGFSTAQSYRRLILPRAFGIALPAYSNEIILMFKASALASTITLMDLTGMARTIVAKTYAPIEIFFAAGCIYVVMAVLAGAAFRLLELWFNRWQRV